MDSAALLEQLSSASLFELYRIHAAIYQMIDDPACFAEVKARLQPGMKITYFDPSQNRLVEAAVVSLHRSRVLVQNFADGQRWEILYAAVNLEGVPVNRPNVPQ